MSILLLALGTRKSDVVDARYRSMAADMNRPPHSYRAAAPRLFSARGKVSMTVAE